ncbi:hypothetical protein RI065_05795 [Mycoplasmatota bacterium zrk1]
MKFIKPDEMEMQINYKSMRLSYIFTTLFMFCWLMVDFIKTGDLLQPLISFIFLQQIIFFGYKIILTNKMSRSVCDEE